MKKRLLSLISAMLCVLAVFLLHLQVFAAPVDTTATADLTVTFAHNGKAIAGSGFELYRIADISVSGKTSLTPPFSGFPVIFETHDAASLRSFALTLKGYVITEDIEPDYTGITNSSGKARFEDIPLGMYLVVGSPVSIEGTIYVPETFIVTLPAEAANESWQYDVSVRTKSIVGIPSEKINLRVLKVWEDGGDTSDRPEEIEVELYLGKQLVDTVVLNKENGWHHTWNNLTGYDWVIAEKNVPNGYKVSVERDGNSFIITNTKEEEPTEPDTTAPDLSNPDESDPDVSTPGGTNPDITNPDNTDPDSTYPGGTAPGSSNPTGSDGTHGSVTASGGTGSSDDDETPHASGTNPSGSGDDKPDLPQTGMLWWPVPVLAFAGIIMFMLGWTLYRRYEDEV